MDSRQLKTALNYSIKGYFDKNANIVTKTGHDIAISLPQMVTLCDEISVPLLTYKDAQVQR